MRDAFHSSALGKAILSRYPESMVESAVGSEPLPQKTGRTLQTLAALQAELPIVRERGYAVDDEENEPGARCLAAPVMDQHGACVGAISVSGPSTRITSERLPELAARVLAASGAISRRLGYSDGAEVRASR